MMYYFEVCPLWTEKHFQKYEFVKLSNMKQNMKIYLKSLSIHTVLFLLLCSLMTVQSCNGDHQSEKTIYTNHFAVLIPGGVDVADTVAEEHGFINKGQIGSLTDYYLFEHQHIAKRSLEFNHHHYRKISSNSKVLWVEQQYTKKRVKRDYKLIEIPDPLYQDQWYLHHGGKGGYDMNVKPAWDKGYTGKTVVVTILDDGIQTNHPDLIQNFDHLASLDINGGDSDPMPQNDANNKHGTRCAGEVAATAYNEYCGVGIAYNASIGGVRMLDGTVTDEVEARALNLNSQYIDIYSASWGPEDDGKTVDGPGRLAKIAFVDGITKGRKGLGSIFVWASGNGGRQQDNCNCDGYTNSVYTLSISSATEHGRKPWYLEECSSTLATTYSSGTPRVDRNVVTVDMNVDYVQNFKKGVKSNPSELCTESHTGTSASAPIAAAICALALEANPHLTWRDMQHLVILTSRPEPLSDEPGWSTNGVGRKFSHKFGYGLMDAAAMVQLAKQWKTVPAQHFCQTQSFHEKRIIPSDFGAQVEVTMETNACQQTKQVINHLEHVQVEVTLSYHPRGNLHIILISPSGTKSSVLLPRPRDTDDRNFNKWPFLSTHFWGESAIGTWKLLITVDGNIPSPASGTLYEWRLIFYGTEEAPFYVMSASSDSNFPKHNFSRQLSRIRQIPEGADSNIKLCAKKGEFADLENLGVCLRTCPDGQFGDEDSVCQHCHPQCKTCYGPNSDNCFSCRSETYLMDAYCVEHCRSGFYKDETLQQCLPCSSNCVTCEGTPYRCLSCGKNEVLQNGHCNICPAGTFRFSADSCVNCFDNCEICSGSSKNDCQSCQLGYNLYNSQCVKDCLSGYYSHQQLRQCFRCGLHCSICDDENVCRTCEPGWKLTDAKMCVRSSLNLTCSKGFYINSEQVCEPCDSSCGNCSGPSHLECITCPPSQYLHLGQCMESCPVGMGHSKKYECIPCPETCSTCKESGPGKCQKCREKYILHEDNCIASCPSRWFRDTRGKCQQCHSSCFTCIEGTEYECSSCTNGHALLNGQCLQSCLKGYYKYTSRNNITECLPCHHSCESCKGPSNMECTTCPGNSTQQDGKCIPCLDDEYYDYKTKKCKKCNFSCARCFGPHENQCDACKSPLRLNIELNRCMPCCDRQHILSKHPNPCCDCSPSGQCTLSPGHPRSIWFGHNSHKDGTASNGNRISTQSAVAIVFIISGSSVLLFFVIFGILQVQSGSFYKTQQLPRDYERVPTAAGVHFDAKEEQVALTQEYEDEEDNLYEKT
ncbi:furin-like protease 2 [Limulus polyphemus]|uniref:Furin-like protease 2 n=1 Tax=Limulus polyphemus TaxID=6850 RepID=A0ABM1B6D9_LIMPO|nr:furin-like protease 2 [Limulus polyphemus]